MTKTARGTAKDEQSSIDFIVVTQKEQGSLNKVRGWQSKVRSQSAKRQHAKGRAKRNERTAKAANQYSANSPVSGSARREAVTATTLLAPKQFYPTNGSVQCGGSRDHSPKCKHGSFPAVCLHCLKAGPYLYQPPVVFLHNLDALSRDDKDDVVRHLQFVPAIVTGPSRDDLFQPIRDASSHMMQASPGVVDWLLAESDAIRSATDPSVLNRLHGRRQRIYRKMNDMLSDPVMCCSDELLNMVLVATCFEYWSEHGRDLPKVRVHYRGLLNLIERRGGLATLFGCAAILGRPLNCLSHFTFSELEITNHIDVEKSCTAFISTLEKLQALTKDNSCSLATIDKTKFANLKHLIHWKSTFGDITERLVQFTSLYLIAIMIMDFGARHDIANKFWSSLSAIIDDRINTTTNATSLSTHILVWMVTRTWININAASTWPGSNGSEKELWITQAGLNALKVFGRVSDLWKDRLIGCLSYWICASCQVCENNDQRYLNHEKFEQLRTECCSSWYQRREASA